MTFMSAHLPSQTTLHHGTFKIEERIGQGGFSITYRATLLALKQEVVIKELFFSGYSVRNMNDTTISVQSLQPGQYEEIKKKFIQEGQTLAQFEHPNILKVNFVFEENNTVYLVFNYIKGYTLKEYVGQHGSLTIPKMVDVTKQLLSALREVHQKDILHRDIKPSNIMINESGKAILIDFGIAKQFADNKTVSNTGAHTPGYAPSEQYAGRRKLGPYTDIYSLSATMYFACTGNRPIDVTDRFEEKLVAPVELNPHIPQTINRLILKGMAVKTQQRHQNIDEFEAELNQAIQITGSLHEDLDSKKTQLNDQKIENSTIIEGVEDKTQIEKDTPPSKPAANLARLPHASFGTRLLAYIIDCIVLSGLIFGGLTIYLEDPEKALLLLSVVSYDSPFLLYLIFLIAGWLYFSISESSAIKASLGKAILGYKVVDKQGSRISFGKASKRYYSKILSGILLFIGYLMILWSPTKQGLHDIIAATVVIKRGVN